MNLKPGFGSVFRTKKVKKKFFKFGSLFLLTLIFFLLFFAVKNTSFGNTDNIKIEKDSINFSTLTLKQKISQMIIVKGDEENINYLSLNIGGIFLNDQDSKEKYKELISKYQNNSKIKLFIATDLEGAWTPFKNNDQNLEKFPAFSKINNSKEAYKIGFEEGSLLRSLGFNLNFAPVAEYRDVAYGGRVFLGDKKEVVEKVVVYLKGLQENVLGTCKHYPGKALIKNLHEEKDIQTIEKEDLQIFEECIKNNVSSIMISHNIVEGKLNSNGLPSSVSKNVLDSLSKFKGLRIADEINMKGLSSFYKDKVDLYIDLINSGEELILDFSLTDKQLDSLLESLNKKVLSGEIDIERINLASKKILQIKGYKLIY
jgi:beta-N-acetylhexosaminidase